MLRQQATFPHATVLWAGKGAGSWGSAVGAGTGEGSAETWGRAALLPHGRRGSLGASEPRSPGHGAHITGWPQGLDQRLELNECFQNPSSALFQKPHCSLQWLLGVEEAVCPRAG